MSTCTDVAPTSVSIALSQWKEAPFYLTDKDRMEAIVAAMLRARERPCACLRMRGLQAW